jgi:hypothetical protein
MKRAYSTSLQKTINTIEPWRRACSTSLQKTINTIEPWRRAYSTSLQLRISVGYNKTDTHVNQKPLKARRAYSTSLQLRPNVCYKLLHYTVVLLLFSFS